MPQHPIDGARAMLASLVDAGVDTCFMNPGTSEMHVVQALDEVPAMRGILALVEGVATGAADGYARIRGRPAAVLLHLGPGLGNGLANLHNARRAHSPVLCIVGAHATDHVRVDAPLQSDIEAAARTVSGWVHTSGSTRDVAADAMRALRATGADGGQVATLVLPADVSWSAGGRPAAARPPVPPPPAAEPDLAEALAALDDGPGTVLLLGADALSEDGLRTASRIAEATGVRLLAERFPARMECGAGVPRVARLAYRAEDVRKQLDGARRLVLVGTTAPVGFFAYPGVESDLVPDDCTVVELADPIQDAAGALRDLAARVPGEGPGSAGPGSTEPGSTQPGSTEPGAGPLTARSVAAAVAACLPADAVVVDEAVTAGAALFDALADAPRHTLLTLTGGAIGQGLPVATGAAVAAPDRPVVAVQADGAALYTIQALWTQARERLDVTTVLINNAAYAILRAELARTGAGEIGERARRMLDLSDPTPSFVDIGHGLGVPSQRVTDTAGLCAALRTATAEPGPHLIEAIVAPVA